VVQEHHARSLHWDFRIESAGVLRSWAVPKGPPLEPGVKRLAVAVEDHPLDYIDFAGVIPPGNYGAGEVLIWDQGTYEMLEETDAALRLRLAGGRLAGVYQLVHTRSNQWLMWRRDDG
jgi:bifunctional non-homologous end joining protein LigD